MSIRWMSFAWTNGPENAQDRYIYLALADNADDEGVAFPSMVALAGKTRYSIDTVRRSLVRLENEGWLTVKKGDGRGNRSQYKLLKRVAGSDPLEGERVAGSDPLEGERVAGSDPLEGKRVAGSDPLEGERVAGSDPLEGESPFKRVATGGIKGSKSASLYGRTVNEPSGKTKTPLTPKAEVPTDANGGATPFAKVSPQPSPPGKVVPINPLGNPEVYRTAGLIALASPEASFYAWTEPDITYAHRDAVVTAARQDADFLGISLGEALQGLLETVPAQVERMDLSRLPYLTDFKKIETYFAKRAYRTDPKNLNGGSNGKSKGEKLLDNAKAAASRLEARFGGNDGDEHSPQSRRLTGRA